MKSKNIFLKISLFIICMFVSLESYAQNTRSCMDIIILWNGGQVQSESLPDGRTIRKMILPEGAKLNETTLVDGNKLQELILSDGKKIQAYLNPSGACIKQVETSPDGTIETHIMEGEVEHITIQNPDGTVLHATMTKKTN